MIYVGVLLAIIVQAYLLGSIESGILISKIFYHDDVRNHGSGNAGMTNIIRTYGKCAGVATFIGDAGKGVLAVIFGQLLFGLLPQTTFSPMVGGYLAFIFAVIGHMKPIYFKFRGGKGVAVAAGCLIAVNPVVVAALIVLFLALFIPFRMVSLGSVAAAVALPVFTVVYGSTWQGLAMPDLVLSTTVALALGAAVVIGHRSNIKRIVSGTEYQFKKKKQDD